MFRLPALLAGLTKLVPFAEWAAPWSGPRMAHCRTEVAGRTMTYGVVEAASATGPVGATAAGPEGAAGTVVLVHGWGLGHSSYRLAAEQLASRGFRVLVPDLPGFGGSSDLSPWRLSFAGFAAALEAFVSQVAVGTAPAADRPAAPPERVHLVGHSFGGAVCTQLAHDAPHLVSSVVLVDAAAGATWTRDESSERLLADRPPWDWAIQLLREFPTGSFPTAAVAAVGDLSRNIVLHLPSLGFAAWMICRSDLRPELSRVAASGTPVSVVWGSSDRVIGRAAFDDQCLAAGCEGVVVEGNHGWPMADPASFGWVISDLLSGGERAA